MIEMNTQPLDKLLKILKENTLSTRVGILGAKNQRSSGAMTSNAEIGVKHEFGDPLQHLPIRSFLRVPITTKLQKYLEEAGAFEKRTINKIIAQGSLEMFLKKLGAICEQIVADAFATGGFGKWKPSNMSLKKNHQTLVETQQLRNSITSEVK